MTTNTDAHTCSYYCERPECVRRQRDELRDRLEAAPPSAPVGEVCIRLNGIGEGGPYPVVNGVCVLPQSVAENLVASAVGQQVKRELLAQWASYKQPAAVDEPCAAVAAIQFALTDPEGMTFLRLWNEGEFDTLRREWPDAPSTVYIGADPLATKHQGDK